MDVGKPVMFLEVKIACVGEGQLGPRTFRSMRTASKTPKHLHIFFFEEGNNASN